MKLAVFFATNKGKRSRDIGIQGIAVSFSANKGIEDVGINVIAVSVNQTKGSDLAFTIQLFKHKRNKSR
jgi:hypothetical protein